MKAIEVFQARFLPNQDGLIEVGGRTWQELVHILSGGEDGDVSPAEPRGTQDFFFPFDRLPSENWTVAPRSFGARRDAGRRAHAGCDLYYPIGTTIHAITSGTVVRESYPFYAETFAVEIDHGSFIARYGEVQAPALVRTGEQITAGQSIAKVGRLVGISVPSAMLHLELYDKSGHGRLTVSAAESARTADGRPFMRRRDLIDPTPKLNEWKDRLSGSSA